MTNPIVAIIAGVVLFFAIVGCSLALPRYECVKRLPFGASVGEMNKAPMFSVSGSYCAQKAKVKGWGWE